MPNLTRSLLLTLACSATCLFAQADSPQSQFATELQVVLRDGRVLKGVVDQRTDGTALWLGMERGRIALSTSIHWDQVKSVWVGDTGYTPAEFRDIAPQFSTYLSPAFSKPDLMPTLPSLSGAPAGPTVFNRVQMLSVEAVAANWDRDAEPDGIELRILPRAANGRVVPLNGHLAVNLLGRDQLPDRGFPQLGNWSQAVHAADFYGPYGATYRLPYPVTGLESNLELQSFGLVSATLSAVGHGHFQADAPVRMRTFNPIRDQLNQHRQHYDSFGRYRARHW